MFGTKLTGLLLAAAAVACGSHETVVPVSTAEVTAVRSSFADQVEVRAYKVPTAGAFPHDVAVGRRGVLWFTEEHANKIGQLDPSTGIFREYSIATPRSAPHGIALDREGNVWFTASARGYIGKLEPRSGRLTTFEIPDARARDPHSLVIDRAGMLWFTVQKAGFVGKLNPRTGAFSLRPLTRPGALPYGITIGNDDVPYVAEFGTNHIARIDPETMEVREYPLPINARPRRIAAAPDGMLYFTDFARGRLGRLDSATGVVNEWRSPSGARSAPYGIAVTPDGLVWYVETGIQPSRLVRFDPRTERFASRDVPSGGVVRSMAATGDGRLFFASSDRDQVIVATPGLGAMAMR